jgi:nucleotide-binding universal stress UspA family protein
MAYKRILVPLDGSPTSERGLKEALRLAKNQQARLALLHVVDDSVFYIPPEGAFHVETLLDDLKTYGRQILQSAESLASRQGVKAESVLVENFAGRVADVITEQARRWRADLIVMGTHGRRGVSRMVMGSDAELVVRNTLVPVLLVRGLEQAKRKAARKKRK